MNRAMIALVAVLPLAGCVTTPETRAEEMAYCQRMESKMGVEHIHDPAESKGMGLNPMNVTHSRCRQMLGIG